jgi:hypothetical protein
MKDAPKELMIDALRKEIRRLHYPIEVMLVCVRRYAAYPLGLRHIEEMMAQRGVGVRSLDRASLVDQDTAGAGCSVSSAKAPGGNELADGRDPHQGRWSVEVPVPCRRSCRPDGRLPAARP